MKSASSIVSDGSADQKGHGDGDGGGNPRLNIVLVNEDTLPPAAAAIASAPWVAVDTEFHVGHAYLPQLLLVQVQVPSGDTYLIDPLTNMLERLSKPLCQVNWVVHGGFFDLRLLLKVLEDLPEQIMDTQIAAGLVQPFFPASLAALVQQYLGVQLDKTATLSDWSQRPLSETQVDYAAKDVQLLAPLWQRLREQLVARGRLEIAIGAAAQARKEALDGLQPNTWRLHRVDTLTPLQAAAFRELVDWREELAHRTDSSRRTIATESALFTLARRAPTTLGQLKGKRGLPKRLWRDHADDILACVQRAIASTTSNPPPYIRRNTRESQKHRWLLCLADALGQEEQFAPGLVLPVPLLEDCVLEDPDTQRLTAMLGWRAPLCQDVLLASLNGKITLSLGPENVELSSADPHGDDEYLPNRR